MKKTILLLILSVAGTIVCLPQPADSSIIDPKTCGAFFDYYYNDSVNTFAEAYSYRFVDQSIGNIYEWNWDFGDGKTSNERNPMHFYSHAGDTVLVCLTIKTKDSCTNNYCKWLVVKQPLIPPDTGLTYKGTGTVMNYAGLDGCGLLINMDNGEILEPVEILQNCVLKEGQRLSLTYTVLTDRVSTCMKGKIVRIDWMEEIRADYCQASFSYYPVPWISSLPPIYQFIDESKGNVISKKWDFGDGTGTDEYGPSHRYQKSGLYTVCLTIYTSDGCTSSGCMTAWFEGADPKQGLCENLIRLTTDIYLNGETCKGSATASLVNKEGNTVSDVTYLWSTGDTGASIYNLCTGTNYSVIVIDSSGCAVSGSFSFGGNTFIPDTLIGFWNFEQYNKSFVFNIPVFSDSIRCVWDFGDGQSAEGNSVNHTYDAAENYDVALRIFDNEGNLLFTQQIPVSAGSPTGVKDRDLLSPEVFPVPAGNTLYIRQGEMKTDLLGIEVISPNGQVVSHHSFSTSPAEPTVEIDVSSLPPGIYMGRMTYSDGSQSQFRFVK